MMAATISALLAMQCEKCPAPTIKVSNHVTAICPIVQWLAVTIHATSAIIQPPIPPLAKITVKCPLGACSPRPAHASPQAGQCIREVRRQRSGLHQQPAKKDGASHV